MKKVKPKTQPMGKKTKSKVKVLNMTKELEKEIEIYKTRALTSWQIGQIKKFVERKGIESLVDFKEEIELPNELFVKLISGMSGFASDLAVGVAQSIMWEAAKESIKKSQESTTSKKKK